MSFLIHIDHEQKIVDSNPNNNRILMLNAPLKTILLIPVYKHHHKISESYRKTRAKILDRFFR